MRIIGDEDGKENNQTTWEEGQIRKDGGKTNYRKKASDKKSRQEES